MENNDIQTIEPIWTENFTAIAMSSSDEYVPYLSVYLTSIVEHSSDNHNYDIIVFERAIKDKNKEILKSIINKDNIVLRFFNPMEVINKYPNIKFPKNYNLECYFRLVAPLFLKHYEKVIFTDIDLITQTDLKDLYSIKLDKSMGACQDLVYSIFLNTPNADWMNYAKQELELNDPYKYFNTGVIILNIKDFNSNNLSYKLLELANKKLYRILEQDILNKFFKDQITYIDDKWNVPILNPKYLKLKKYMPKEYNTRYEKCINKPAIIHWAGYLKPWQNPREQYAYLWWMYARKSPFYEMILERFIRHISLDRNEIEKIINYTQNYKNIVINYWFSKLLYFVTTGKWKQYYFEKKNMNKKKIQIIKDFRKRNK